MCRLWGRAQNIGVDKASCRRRETPVVPTVGEETEHERMSTRSTGPKSQSPDPSLFPSNGNHFLQYRF